MRRRKVSIVLTMCLTLGWLSLPLDTVAHHMTVAEVVELLNRSQVKAETGIGEAKVDPRLKRHLIIMVNNCWHKLSASRRLRLAQGWLRAWKEAVKNGIVSVLDDESKRAVVNYGPSGRASLVGREGG